MAHQMTAEQERAAIAAAAKVDEYTARHLIRDQHGRNFGQVRQMLLRKLEIIDRTGDLTALGKDVRLILMRPKRKA